MELSQIEDETFAAVYELLREQWNRGIAVPDPPSVRQIMRTINKSSTSVVRHRIHLLVERGLIAAQDYSGGCLTRLTVDGLALAEKLYGKNKAA